MESLLSLLSLSTPVNHGNEEGEGWTDDNVDDETEGTGSTVSVTAISVTLKFGEKNRLDWNN